MASHRSRVVSIWLYLSDEIRNAQVASFNGICRVSTTHVDAREGDVESRLTAYASTYRHATAMVPEQIRKEASMSRIKIRHDTFRLSRV